MTRTTSSFCSDGAGKVLPDCSGEPKWNTNNRIRVSFGISDHVAATTDLRIHESTSGAEMGRTLAEFLRGDTERGNVAKPRRAAEWW